MTFLLKFICNIIQVDDNHSEGVIDCAQTALAKLLYYCRDSLKPNQHSAFLDVDKNLRTKDHTHTH